MIKKFYYKNLAVLAVEVLCLFAAFFVNIIITPILIRDYGFAESTLSHGNMGLILGISLGTIFTRYILQFKINYFWYLRRPLEALVLVQLGFIGLATAVNQYPEYPLQSIYPVFRFIEGFAQGQLTFVVVYLLGYKMMSNQYKGSIQGMLLSSRFVIKFITPIMAGALISFTGYSLSPYVVTMMVYLYVLFLVTKQNKSLFRSYYKYICKRYRPPKLKFKYIKFSKVFDFSYLKEISKEDRKGKVFDVLTIVMQNSLRPIYDLYMILMLTFYFHLDIIAAGFVISMMMAGLALSALISYGFDKLYQSLGEYRSGYQSSMNGVMLVLVSMALIGLYFNPLDWSGSNLVVWLSVFMFVWGMVRGIYNDWSNRRVYELSAKEGSLSNFKSGLLLFSDIGHMSGYLILSGVYVLAGFAGVIGYFTMVAIISLALHFIHYRKV